MDHTPNPDYPDGYPDWKPEAEQINAALYALDGVRGLYFMMPEGSWRQTRAKAIYDSMLRFAEEEGWWKE